MKKNPQDIILLHMYHKWRSYDIWFLKDKTRQTIFCHFGPFFPFCPSDNPKPQKSDFEKLKKTPEDIIFLHMCTINDNHMIYGSRNMEWKKTPQDIILLHIYHNWRSYDKWFLKDKTRQTIFCHFGSVLPFRSSDNPKPQKPNFEKLKKTLEDIIILHMCTRIIWSMITGICSATDKICCHFGPFLEFLPPNNPKNQNIKKMWKNLEKLSFYTCVPKMKII